MTDTLPPVRGKLTANRALNDLTWLRVGGAADWLFQPADIDDLAQFLCDLDPEIPVFPMGVGSNLIVRDGGLRAVVIRLGRGFNQIDTDGTRVTAIRSLTPEGELVAHAAMGGAALLRFERNEDGSVSRQAFNADMTPLELQ